MLGALMRRESAGDPLAEFSKRFAQMVGVRHAIPAPSARGALCALLHALQLPPGSEVILPGVLFHSFPWLIRQWGLEVRFADVDIETGCMDPAAVERAVTANTSAILPVHLYGRACDMAAIGAIARAHDLVVIEDCAQSCGARSGSGVTGALGVGGVFSFHHAKNLAALTWGMLTTDSTEIAETAAEWLTQVAPIGRRALLSELGAASAIRVVTQPILWRAALAPFLRAMNWARVDPIALIFDEVPDGTPVTVSPQRLRMPVPLQARVGLSRLARIEGESLRRETLANRLRDRLSSISGVTPPAAAAPGEHIYLSFVIGVDERDRVRRRLMALGVDTHVGSIWAASRIPGFEGCGETPIAEQFVDRRLHLPIYHSMSEADVDYIADALARAVRG